MFISKNIHNALAIACRAMAVFIPAASIITNYDYDTAHGFRIVVYAAEAVLLAAALVYKPKLADYKLDYSLLGLCAVALMSLAVNFQRASVRSIGNTAFFIMSLMLLSPLLKSSRLTYIRQLMFKWLIIFFITATLLSLATYPHWAGEKHHIHHAFKGLLNEPMLLSIIASISATAVSWMLLFKMPDLASNRRIKAWVLSGVLVASIVTMILSGSRSACVCYAISIIPMLVACVKNRISIRYFALPMAITAIIAAGFSGKLFSIIKFKMELGSENKSITYSRDNFWHQRLIEFAEHPILGVGIGNVNNLNIRHLAERGGRLDEISNEQGSSWLSILSNLGAAGLAVFIAFNINLIRRLRFKEMIACRDDSARRRWLYFSLWLSLMFYGIFEGYVLYAGANIFMFYWLLTSMMDQRRG